ncbi:hypothetical protein [Thalassovita sp.]|uniref:hypothetical protein n=1 Tax=Thalassovita sp. TaxID=1979401 RepID=UPI0029DE572F|nr:hypothetical protein [Thalassovita sp.]
MTGVLLVNGAITTALFGLGRAIMSLTAPVALPLWLPIVTCALAAVWGMWRYRWTPEPAEMDSFLDEALSQIQAMTPLDEPDSK